MESIEKQLIEDAVKTAMEETMEMIRPILDKYNVTMRTCDIVNIAEIVTKFIQEKV